MALARDLESWTLVFYKNNRRNNLFREITYSDQGHYQIENLKGAKLHEKKFGFNQIHKTQKISKFHLAKICYFCPGIFFISSVSEIKFTQNLTF